MSHGSKGFSLLESLTALAVTAVLALIVVPRLNRSIRRTALRAVAVSLTQLLIDTREQAATLSQGIAVRFFAVDGVWQYARYADGNGNGVRTSEIASGIDPQIEPPRPLFTGTGFTPGIVEGVPDPDSGALLTKAIPPVNFNHSSLCSFSPEGSGTPGTLYVTDNSGLIAAIRSSGSSGYVHTLFFDPESHSWIR
jgi:prepilin-type N-terminal cleavage/methylation domain-containing protein